MIPLIFYFSAKEFGAEFVSFDELLRQSDFVIIVCPLNEETKEMFNEDAFNKMKPNAILVNVARGGEFVFAYHCYVPTGSKGCFRLWAVNWGVFNHVTPMF